jgi:hypothetical protein
MPREAVPACTQLVQFYAKTRSGDSSACDFTSALVASEWIASGTGRFTVEEIAPGTL